MWAILLSGDSPFPKSHAGIANAACYAATYAVTRCATHLKMDPLLKYPLVRPRLRQENGSFRVCFSSLAFAGDGHR
jgi:hypothetical protein